jgi:hypothetical protein
MEATSSDRETVLPDPRAGLVSTSSRIERPSRAPAPEPFPALEVGPVVLDDLELVRLEDERNFGKYRIQGREPGQDGPVFQVTLFGATCSKVELLTTRKLGWSDYVAAMKHSIEREIGYWQNRVQPVGTPGPLVPRALDVTVRDTDFVLA